MTYKNVQLIHEIRMGVTVALVTAAVVDTKYPMVKYKIADAVKKPVEAIKEKVSKKA